MLSSKVTSIRISGVKVVGTRRAFRCQVRLTTDEMELEHYQSLKQRPLASDPQVATPTGGLSV